MSEYNQWRQQVASYQAPLRAWAKTKEAGDYFDKLFKEHGDKPSEAPSLSEHGIHLLRESPISRFIAQCNKSNKRGSIVIDDVMITVLTTDAEVLEVVPLDYCKVLQDRKKTAALPWLDGERFGHVVYFAGNDPQGHWSAWYYEPVKPNPRNELEVSTVFMLFTFHLLTAKDPNAHP